METAASSPNPKSGLFALRGRVYRSLVAVFVIFIAARSLLLWWQYDETLAAEQRRAENLTLALSEHLDRTFGAVESSLNQLAVYSERIGGPKAPPDAWSPVLAAALAGLSGLGSLNVVDAEGTVTASTNPAVTGTSRRDFFLYQRLKESKDNTLVIAPPTPSTFTTGVTIPVGLALRDPSGQFVGLVAGTFQPERLRGFYEALDIGPRGTIQVLHPDGYLLYTQPASNRPQLDVVTDHPILNAARKGVARGFLEAPLITGGDPYLTAWRTLPRSPLIVAVSIARLDALSEWWTETYIVGGVAGFMGLILGIAGMWLTSSKRVHARTLAEREQADEALRANQAQFQAIMDHTPLLVFVKDLQGRYTFVNHAAEQWVGAKGKFAVGKRSSDVMPTEAAEAMQQTDATVAATRVPLQRQTTIQTPIGPRAMLSVKFPLLDASGAVSAIGTIVTDVTDQKHAEAQLSQAQRMEAVGQLTGGVAHDFNNMLTAILLNAEVLASQVKNESHRALAEAMRLAAERGADLTKRLLAFGRRQSLMPQSTDVNELLDSMEPLMRRTLGEHIEIKLIRGKELWPATVDQSQLENAIVNLAVNARDAMTDGGRLTIETANVELDDDYVAADPEMKPGPYVMVAVSDTGDGMPADVVTRAFEPFFTTKDVGKGTGLGLSMVYGFIRQTGGQVRIYSEVGVGTVVRLYLPRSEDSAIAMTTPTSEPAELPTGTELILLVEDDPLVRTYTESQLSALGYQVVAAENAQRAMEEVEKGCHPDLLFTDMVMPGMNGRELADKLLQRWPDLKVLYTSGYAHNAFSASPEDAEAIKHLLGKPYRRRDLAMKIREVLEEHTAAA